MTSSVVSSARPSQDAVAGQDTVTVGVDGSPASYAALRWAIREADRMAAGLTVCNVRSLRGLNSTRQPQPAGSEDVLEHACAMAAHRLGGERVRSVRGYGDAAHVLARVGRRARLLVLGTHGYFGFGERLVPPTALRVIAQASRPVVVHSNLAGDRGPFAGHVVVGVDGSPGSRAALEFAFWHAAALRRPLAAVLVDGGPAGRPWIHDGPDAPSTAELAAGDLVAAELEPFERAFADVPVARVVYDGPVVPALIRAAAGADLLVVGDRGHAPAARALLGSVPRQAIGVATCPMAVVPVGLSGR